MSEQRPAQNPDAPQGDQSAEQHNPERAKIPEKLKAEKLEPKEGKEIKLEIKEKPEKFEKLEKEGKHEKFEKLEKVEKFEKPEKLEGKAEIKEKPEKFEKDEAKEHKTEKFEIKELKFEKLEFEGPLPSAPVPGPGPVQVDRETLLRYAAALEKAGQDLRHFIEQSERPDLTHGALHNEPDDQDEPRAGT